MMQKSIEEKALIVTIIVNTIITGAGIWVFLATKMNALFLDCFFSFVALVSTIFAAIISKNSKKTTNHYPHGIYFLEPLYAILKSLLTLSLLVVAAVSAGESAFEYWVTGNGIVMNTAPVLPYALSMTVLCLGLSFYNSRQNKRINGVSTMLSAEAKTNFIDGLQSFGVGIGILLLGAVDINSSLGFLHYTGDFFVTTILVLFSIKEPIQVLQSAFRELSGGTVCDRKIQNAVSETLKKYFHDDTAIENYEIYKIGMKIKVQIYFAVDRIANKQKELNNFREQARRELLQQYENIEIVYLF